jgi:hypothetical protein
MSSTVKTPLEWKLDPPATPYRGMSAAFTAAYDAGVFRGRLNELMSAEEYLSLVTPYLPAQSNHKPTRITLVTSRVR